MWATVTKGVFAVAKGVPTLAMLQLQVGGHIEMVGCLEGEPWLPPDVRVVVYANEDGRGLGLPWTYCRSSDGAMIVGDLAITCVDSEGETCGGTEAMLRQAWAQR